MMGISTKRILQSTDIAANVANVAARELGITSDTERPVIGSTIGGSKYIGTEELITITTTAPAAFAIMRRSRTIVYIDTDTAAGNVAIDIRAGAQVAGYDVEVIVNGTTVSRKCTVTYATGVSQDIYVGRTLRLEWTGAAWIRLGFEPLTGTFTPTLIGSITPGVQTYTTQYGEYSKTGRLIHCQGRITISAKDAGISGNVLIGGLPFISSPTAALRGACLIGYANGITYPAGTTQLAGTLGASAQAIGLYGFGSGSVATVIPVANMANATDIIFSIEYLTAY